MNTSSVPGETALSHIDTCPHCGAVVAHKDKWETQYACGTFYPVDGPSERGKECRKKEAMP